MIDNISIDNNKKNNKKKESVKKNYFFNLTYQIFLFIIPLITTPYISRVLLPEGVGKYSFSISLINYFIIFGALGFGYYSQREIAKYQDDFYKQNVVFWEINICRAIPVVISIIVNILLCTFNVYKDYNNLMWVLTINIFNVALDINYFFQGNEKFKSIVIHNVIIKTIGIIATFIFVKNYEDLTYFALINSLSLIFSSISMWLPLRKMLVKVKIFDLHPFKHLKGTLILFLPAIAVSIYTILDKTLIGILIKDTYIILDESGTEIVKRYADVENGYYEQSEKIVKMILTIITSIGIVMIPRNTNEISQGNYEKVRENIYFTGRLVFLIGLPMTLGLINVTDYFVPWFLGSGYEKCNLLIKILSPLIIIIGLSNVFGLQYLIPTGQDKKFTAALIIGSITNVVLNIFFIQQWWSIGAVLATIVAESLVTGCMAIMIKKEIKFYKILVSSWRYFIAGFSMFIILYFISFYIEKKLIYAFILTFIGAMIYFFILLLLRDKIVIDALRKLIRKIKYKNKRL